MFDTDGDGLYDIYEVVSNTNVAGETIYTAIDTDGDGTPNHLDVDDDGDGILSEFENNDNDHNHNPNDALNTDGDIQPNYLDIDDDNDGYATWETLEGGIGHLNAILPTEVNGLAYTTDTDQDEIPNYLDNTNGYFQENGPINTSNFVSLIGDKRYELANHLGNVLVVVNDKKLPEFNIENTPSSGLMAFNADVLSFNDYYPFGMLVPNRHGNSPAYRYGFQGQEKDDELKGEGNSIDFGARMYDPRVGRWFATDLLESKYPQFTPYNFALNNPLLYIDFNGEDILIPIRNKADKYNTKSENQELSKMEADIILGDLQKLTNDNLVLEIVNTKKGDFYKVKIANQKNTSKNLPEGSKLIKNLTEGDGKGQNVVIQYTTSEANGIERSTNGSSIITYNPDHLANGEGFVEGFITNKDNTKGRPSFIGLAHELIHADENLDGKINKNDVEVIQNDGPKQFGKKILITKDELMVRKRDNLIRKEHLNEVHQDVIVKERKETNETKDND